MGKLIDLTGQRFGRLTVIKHVKKPADKGEHSAYWLCHCDCGQEKVISSHSLLTGRTKSCGCLLKDNMEKVRKQSGHNKIDLTGKRFGKLTVLYEVTDPDFYDCRYPKLYWHCRCDCGQEVDIRGDALRYGKATACKFCTQRQKIVYISDGKRQRKVMSIADAAKLLFTSPRSIRRHIKSGEPYKGVLYLSYEPFMLN